MVLVMFILFMVLLPSVATATCNSNVMLPCYDEQRRNVDEQLYRFAQSDLYDDADDFAYYENELVPSSRDLEDEYVDWHLRSAILYGERDDDFLDSTLLRERLLFPY